MFCQPIIMNLQGVKEQYSEITSSLSWSLTVTDDFEKLKCSSYVSYFKNKNNLLLGPQRRLPGQHLLEIHRSLYPLHQGSALISALSQLWLFPYTEKRSYLFHIVKEAFLMVHINTARTNLSKVNINTGYAVPEGPVLQ